MQENLRKQGNCLDSQDIGGVVPAQANALLFNGGKWNPGPVVPAPGTAAIGVDFVFQPGGPVPAAAPNAYPTEPALWAAVNAALLVTAGPLSIAVDSSHGAALFALPHNYQGRVRLVGATPTTGGNTLTIADGAIQTDVAEIRDGLLVFVSSATVQSFAFTPATAAFSLWDGAALINLGAHAATDLLGGQFLTVLVGSSSGIEALGAGAIWGMPIAGALLDTFKFGNLGLNLTNLVSGIAGTTWAHVGDASWIPVVKGAYAGTFTQHAADKANGIAYLAATQPALLPPPLSVGGEDFTVQQAIGIHTSPVDPIGAALTIDATQLDETIVCGVAGLVITCPANFPVGREITLIDSSGGVGANAFAFTPTAPETVGVGLAGVSRVFTQVEAKAVTLKKVSATNWRVKSSSTLV